MKTSRRVVRGPGGSTTSYTSSYSSSSSGFASGTGNHNGFASSRNGYVNGGISSYGRSSSRDEDEAKLEDGLTYDEIRAQCLQQNRLFEDPELPANNSSIFPSKRSPHPFEWKRPGELCEDPQLFVGGASRLDIQQGNLGNCWLLAAISCLCQYPDLMKKVIPDGQGFSAAEGYCGMFRFSFWVFGKWKEVIIDDKLPTMRGRLMFMHSPNSNEFWAALLEKGYAKLYGSYESLTGGSSSEAMEDFTGGITEMFDLMQNVPQDLFKVMFKAVERESMMGCSVDQGGMAIEGELANGLIVGHAYSVTDVKTIDLQANRGKNTIQLVRARNPWGNECEWKGAWSDNSKEWSMIPARERERLGLVNSNDGEFWMSYEDFVCNFSKLEVCNLGPNSGKTGKCKKRFEESVHEGSWKKRMSAGGCRNYRDKHWTNPQYRVTVIDGDEGDDDNTGTLIVALLQKQIRDRRARDAQLLIIGYAIYRLKDPNCGPLDKNFFSRNKPVAKSQFIDMREVTGRHKLEPGSYCIVPSTFEPGEEGDFLLRVYTEKPISSREIDEETKIGKRPPMNRSISQLEAEAERKMRQMFKEIAGDDLQVDADELKNIMNTVYMKKFKFNGFSEETCRSLVAMKDVGRTGKLSYEECKKLYQDIRLWENVFINKDLDKSGTLDSYELRSALHEIGVSVSNSTFNSLVQRYADNAGVLYFNDYILCISRLCRMFEIFGDVSGGTNTAQFSLEDFVSLTMYS